MTPTTERKAAAEIHDSEELTREFRMATGAENSDRRSELSARAKELRQQWQAEHPEEVAAQERHRREQWEAELQKERVEIRLRQHDREALGFLIDAQNAARTAEERTFSVSEKRQQEARQAERRAQQAEEEAQRQRERAARAESGQTPRGVPFADTSLAQKPEGHRYTPQDFCEALKASRPDAIRRALRSWDKGKGTKRGSRWGLTRPQAEAFWERYRHERHEKPHPPRADTNQ